MPLVSIVILNYNGRELLKKCLDSVNGLNYRNFEVIVVDMTSTDGSADTVRKQYPSVILLEIERTGIYAASNLGIKVAKGTVLVPLLNNDMTVDRYWLDHLVSALRQKEIGIVDSKVYSYGTNRISTAGNMINWNHCWTIGIGSGELDRGQYGFKREVDVAELIVVRRDVVEKIGGFDEEYLFYYGDVDYCVRAREAGYKTMYIPRAVVWHRESSTIGYGSPRQVYALERDGLRFLITHSPASLMLFRFYYRTLSSLKALLGNLLRKRINVVRAQIGAILWNLLNLKKTMRSRAS
jgi:hypothetical protein